MQWDDRGYLVNKNKYGENSAIVEFIHMIMAKVLEFYMELHQRK